MKNFFALTLLLTSAATVTAAEKMQSLTFTCTRTFDTTTLKKFTTFDHLFESLGVEDADNKPIPVPDCDPEDFNTLLAYTKVKIADRYHFLQTLAARKVQEIARIADYLNLKNISATDTPASTLAAYALSWPIACKNKKILLLKQEIAEQFTTIEKKMFDDSGEHSYQEIFFPYCSKEQLKTLIAYMKKKMEERYSFLQTLESDQVEAITILAHFLGLKDQEETQCASYLTKYTNSWPLKFSDGRVLLATQEDCKKFRVLQIFVDIAKKHTEFSMPGGTVEDFNTLIAYTKKSPQDRYSFLQTVASAQIPAIARFAAAYSLEDDNNCVTFLQSYASSSPFLFKDGRVLLIAAKDYTQFPTIKNMLSDFENPDYGEIPVPTCYSKEDFEMLINYMKIPKEKDEAFFKALDFEKLETLRSLCHFLEYTPCIRGIQQFMRKNPRQ